MFSKSPNLLTRFSARLRALGGPTADQVVVVAVSGGADSTALLALLNAMPASRRPQVHALHVQHGLRGKASQADEAAVLVLCERFKFPLTVVRPRLNKGSGIEEKARKARLKAYRETCTQVKAAFLLTAHHQGDRAETLLMNLARGSGLQGAGALGPWAMLPGAEGLILLRPLLEETPDNLRAWLVREGIGWREDASNQDKQFSRNRLRHEVLPTLEKTWPGAGAHLAAFSAKAAQSAQWISTQASRALDARNRQGQGLDLRSFGKDVYLDEQVLRCWLSRLGVVAEDAAVKRVVALIIRKRGCTDLGKGLQARVEGGRLLSPVVAALPPARVNLIEGEQRLPEFGLKIILEQKKPPRHLQVTKNSFWFSCSALQAGFVLRPPRVGEKIHPFGMKGHRLIADVLAEARVGASQRDRTAVLSAVEKPRLALAIVGIRRAEGHRLDPDCIKAWKISWKRLI